MKVLKNLFLVLGLLVVIGAAVTAGIVMGIYLPVLVRLARESNVGQVLTDPTMWVLIATAAGIVGGLLVGLGIGLPRRTANALRNETIEVLHRQTTADAAVAAAEHPVVVQAPPTEHPVVVQGPPAEHPVVVHTPPVEPRV
jgi:hypothetical protein